MGVALERVGACYWGSWTDHGWDQKNKNKEFILIPQFKPKASSPCSGTVIEEQNQHLSHL